MREAAVCNQEAVTQHNEPEIILNFSNIFQLRVWRPELRLEMCRVWEGWWPHCLGTCTWGTCVPGCAGVRTCWCWSGGEISGGLSGRRETLEQQWTSQHCHSHLNTRLWYRIMITLHSYSPTLSLSGMSSWRSLYSVNTSPLLLALVKQFLDTDPLQWESWVSSWSASIRTGVPLLSPAPGCTEPVSWDQSLLFSINWKLKINFLKNWIFNNIKLKTLEIRTNLRLILMHNHWVFFLIRFTGFFINVVVSVVIFFLLK